jgi:hypothetical protein
MSFGETGVFREKYIITLKKSDFFIEGKRPILSNPVHWKRTNEAYARRSAA